MRTYWADIPQRYNTECCFVCTLPTMQSVEMRWVAKDIYNLYINGKFVQYGPVRAAKGYARVEKINLDEYLTAPNNKIAIYVQSNATKALQLAEESPIFGVELIKDGQVVKTAKDFCCYEMTDKLQKVEKMSVQRGFVEVYCMEADRAKSTETFSGHSLKDVPCPSLLERCVNVSRNKHIVAEEYECGSVSIDNDKVWHNPFTNVLESGEGLFGYKRSECDCILSRELASFVYHKGDKGELKYRSFSFGKVYAGKFNLALTAKTDCTIWLVYDDILIDGKVQFNREQIIHGLKWSLLKGDYHLHSQEVYEAQYVTLIFEGEIDIDAVSLTCIENPNVKDFSGRCNDKDLAKIVQAATRSFAQNAYDIFTDCPSRERAGWLCDSYFMGEAEGFLTGNHKVEKNFLENYLLYQNNGYYPHDGIIPMCYPSEPRNANDYIPNWILWYVLQLERYLTRTGDNAFVSLCKKRVYDILEYFHIYENEYELLENLDGWVFIEWSKANDFTAGVNFPSNMLYAAAITAAGKMFQDGTLIAKAQRIKKRIIQLSYRNGLFADNAVRIEGELHTTKNISETCQTYACFFEIFTSEENPAYYERFWERFDAIQKPERVCPSNMFMGYIMRLMVLFREQHYTQLLKECKQAFLGMAEKTGTLWELFSEQASCNHGFGSIVAKLVVQAQEAIDCEKV